MDNRFICFALIIIIAGVIAACDNNDNNPVTGTPAEQWQALDVDDYEIEQRVNCFCLPPAGLFHKITVQDGEITKIEDVRDGSVIPNDSFALFRTIDELFGFLDQIDPDSVAVYEVQFDENAGFLKFIYIDFEAQIADEELGYELRNFKEL